MKKIFLPVLILFLFSFSIISAQLKIGYVDSEAIIKQLPDAQDAQKNIDLQIDKWEKEIKKLRQKWKDKFDDYQRRKLIMSKQKRAEMEKELVDLEQDVTRYKQNIYGENGKLFKLQEELMKPIQNQIFNAIDEVAKEGNFDFIFDRSGDLIFLYAKEKYDVTPQVLNKLQ